MNVRDQILAVTDDRKSEKITVPEWGDVELVVRELSVKDRGAYIQSGMERVEVAGGYDYVPLSDPLSPARLVVASVFDTDGQKVFTDADVELVGDRAPTVVDRIADVARRLSGLDVTPAEAVEEAGKDSAQTATGSSSSG